MTIEKLLPCPFCGGEPEEDSGGVSEFYGHEHQDLWVTCKQCGAEVGCYTGSHKEADAPCSCHHDIRKIAYAKWNMRTTKSEGEQ